MTDDQLTLEQCFWHADIMDIDLSRATKLVRIVTAPEVVPCLPDPRALTRITFYDVSKFEIESNEAETTATDDSVRCWSVDSVSKNTVGNRVQIRIGGNRAPQISIACSRFQCELLPVNTRETMGLTGNRFVSLFPD